ncbi:MAG: type II toxin-antitoxin system RelE/ParE family toxin [Bacteroidetes bacterium]|nr:type II toxin-antitoxin system RelE/ParE family toxin [Bacteroidota bacterium]
MKRIYAKQIFEAFKVISENPASGKEFKVDNRYFKGFKTGSHIIFYKLNSELKLIEIIRILHLKMDLENRLLGK